MSHCGVRRSRGGVKVITVCSLFFDFYIQGTLVCPFSIVATYRTRAC